MSSSDSPKGQNGDEDGLLVNMPAEHEGPEGADHQAAEETAGVVRASPEAEHRRLRDSREGRLTTASKKHLHGGPQNQVSPWIVSHFMGRTDAMSQEIPLM